MRPGSGTAVSLALLALLDVRSHSARGEFGSPRVTAPGTSVPAGEAGAIKIVLANRSWVRQEASWLPRRRRQPWRTRSFAPRDGGLLIIVPMQAAGQVTLTQNGREILVSFPHPLPEFNAQALQDESSGLLEAVSVGYDTLLLRVSPGVTVSKTAEQGDVRLTVQPTTGGTGSEVLPAEAATEIRQGRRATPAHAGRPAHGADRPGLGSARPVRRLDPDDARKIPSR